MMSNKIDITVVIPCYNDGAFIQEAIESVNTQTLKAVEIIIIDDASTDNNTIDILKNISQENVQIIFLEKNCGPAMARNRGIELAKGKYILPLDADDKIAPTYLEKAKYILDTHPEMGIVYCEAEFFGNKKGKWELPRYNFPDILVGNMIFATALYRKSDWETIGGYNEKMLLGNEDYDFWLSILELKKEVYQIPETLFYYRIKEISRTTILQSNENNEILSYVQIYHNHQKLYNKHIKIFFKELKRRDKLIIEKDKLIIEKDKLIIEKYKEVQQKDKLIIEKYKEVQQKDMQIQTLGDELFYARSVIDLRDKQVSFLSRLADSLRIKNRLKSGIKKLIPTTILKKMGYSKNPKLCMSQFPNAINEAEEIQTYSYCEPLLSNEIQQEIESFNFSPLISVIMPVYNVSPKWLDLAIKSVENQWYKKWELCISDDKSTKQETLDYLKSLNHPNIKVIYLKENLNISGASNAALEVATGEYIALLDNDDEITPDALYEMVRAINEENAEFIYSDEDFISTEGVHSNPHFKPDFSPDLLLSHNYITHFTCFSKKLLDKTGNFNPKFDGSQDYDLFLRLTENTNKIFHIPKVLYHWRMLETSTSVNSEAKPEALERGRVALEESLKRRKLSGTVEHANLHHYFRVKYTISDAPLVSIIIPFKDKPELLDMSINSILEKSSYQNYEIIGISNNSEDPETFKKMAALENKDTRVSFYEYNVDFNYADINNHAVASYAKGEHILLLNNDIEVISESWIEAMLEHSQRTNIGCVGAKLYYPNDTVQHAGIIIGLGGYAGHSHKMFSRDNPGYFNRLNVIQNLSAVTAACLMVKKTIWDEVNGMDAVRFKVAYNDVDFCLRVREKDYLNLYTPYAEMYHHESISRGYETTPDKIARFQTEKDALAIRHKNILQNGDPYYNPNLTYYEENFGLKKT